MARQQVADTAGQLVQQAAALLDSSASLGDDEGSRQALASFASGGCAALVVTARSDAPLPGQPSSGPTAHPSGEAGVAAATEENNSSDSAAPTEPATAPPPPPTPPPPPQPARLAAFAQSLPASLQGQPCIHFTRGEMQQEGAAEAATAPTLLLPSGPTPDSLRLVLQHVFTPWLARQADAAASGGAGGSAAGGGRPAAALGELLAATQRFGGQLEQAAKQLGRKRELPLPQGVDLSDSEAAAKNEEALAECERVEEQWVRLITGTLQQEGQRAPQGRGPLAEVAFWQERSAAYNALYEQLSLPVVRAVQAAVERGSMDAQLVASFKTQMGDLMRLTLEARDNVKFLFTLERHFKTITDGPLQSVADTLQPMLNALRMIWIISRYYGDDVRMSNLLERISHGLQDRLRAAVDVGTLFRGPPAASLKLVATCKAIADGWYASYMQMRAKIEESGHDARWEFSKQALFEETNYAAEVCGELLGMLGAVDDFCKFLGPDLKAVTGDEGVVEGVAAMVQRMVAPVEGAAFNVLDCGRSVEWRGIKQRFARDAEEVKLATRDLIDTCFRKLRSVEAAAHLLQSFKRIQTQGAIARQMEQKLADVLEHFAKEVDTVRWVFEDSKNNPPVTRNMPPVAGALRWARGLFGKVKRTLARLQGLADLEAIPAGQSALAACKDLARLMLQYEKQCYDTWLATAEHIAASSLQQPVLCQEVLAEEEADYSGVPAAGAVQERIAINLAPPLLRLIREAKYLDQLGFSVPEVVVNTALQERRLRAHVEELRLLLEHYYKAVEGLSSAERALLADHLGRLEGVLGPGFTRINWNSLAISDFAAGAEKALEEFEALVGQIRKNTQLLERALHRIARGPLVPPDAPTAAAADNEAAARGADEGAAQPAATTTTPPPVPDTTEFYENYEQFRQAAVEGLVGEYRSMTPLLTKIEELVVGTSSGKAPKLAAYYAYWERRVFAAVNSMVLGALDAVQKRLEACAAGGRAPVLTVTLSLIQPEVVLAPSTGEVTKLLLRATRNLAESAKAFRRWQDGTCLECPEQYVYGEDSEPFVFSFFQDVSQSPPVIKAMLAANHTVQKATTALSKYVEGWRRHSAFWKTDRSAVLAKLRARRPSHAAFEQRLAQCQRAVEDLQALPPFSDIDFVRVDSAPLLGALGGEAGLWLRGVRELMAEADLPARQAWEERLASLQAAVVQPPNTPEEVSALVAAQDAVLAAAGEAAAACAELEERARTRLLYSSAADVAGLQAELDAACQLRSGWAQLAAQAEQRRLADAAQGQPKPGTPAAPAEAQSALEGTPAKLLGEELPAAALQRTQSGSATSSPRSLRTQSTSRSFSPSTALAGSAAAAGGGSGSPPATAGTGGRRGSLGRVASQAGPPAQRSTTPGVARAGPPSRMAAAAPSGSSGGA